MDFSLINLFLHLDKYLEIFVQQYGVGIYVILFLIIFVETGLVIMPFLPGDSLLFAAGAIAVIGEMNVFLLILSLSVAAILGDSLNYWLGRKFGARFFVRDFGRLFNKKHLESANAFYHKHGGKTIVLARFVPIIRTFAPFVAGMGKMNYSRFFAYNVFGGLLWVITMVYAGYLFGNIPFVKDNFSIVVLGIVGISILPLIIKWLIDKFK